MHGKWKEFSNKIKQGVTIVTILIIDSTKCSRGENRTDTPEKQLIPLGMRA